MTNARERVGFHGLIRIRERDHHCNEFQQKVHYIKSTESQEIEYVQVHTCPWKKKKNDNKLYSTFHHLEGKTYKVLKLQAKLAFTFEFLNKFVYWTMLSV